MNWWFGSGFHVNMEKCDLENDCWKTFYFNRKKLHSSAHFKFSQNYFIKYTEQSDRIDSIYRIIKFGNDFQDHLKIKSSSFWESPDQVLLGYDHMQASGLSERAVSHARSSTISSKEVLHFFCLSTQRLMEFVQSCKHTLRNTPLSKKIINKLREGHQFGYILYHQVSVLCTKRTSV